MFSGRKVFPAEKQLSATGQVDDPGYGFSFFDVGDVDSPLAGFPDEFFGAVQRIYDKEGVPRFSLVVGCFFALFGDDGDTARPEDVSDAGIGRQIGFRDRRVVFLAVYPVGTVLVI